MSLNYNKGRNLFFILPIFTILIELPLIIGNILSNEYSEIYKVVIRLILTLIFIYFIYKGNNIILNIYKILLIISLFMTPILLHNFLKLINELSQLFLRNSFQILLIIITEIFVLVDIVINLYLLFINKNVKHFLKIQNEIFIEYKKYSIEKIKNIDNN